MERSRVLGRTPRPLTDEEKAVLREAVGPLLPDMDATGQTRPGIREEAHHDRGEDATRSRRERAGVNRNRSRMPRLAPRLAKPVMRSHLSGAVRSAPLQ